MSGRAAGAAIAPGERSAGQAESAVTGGVVSRAARSVLADALDALPQGVVVLGSDWTIRHVNRLGADLLGRRPAELIDRNLWTALPKLGGTISHSLLLHARDAGHRVTWQGFHATTDRWLNASAVVVGDSLHMQFHEMVERTPEEPGACPDVAPAAAGSDGGSRDRLRFLAAVSEAMISTLDTAESATKLVELLVDRMCDWAIVTVLGDDGMPSDRGWAHADPALLPALDTYLNGRARRGADDSPMAQALLSGQPVQMTTMEAEFVEASLTTEEVRQAWQRLDTTSGLIVPLRVRNETFGVLALMNSSRRPPHTEVQIATAVEVARRAALALDSARLRSASAGRRDAATQLLTPPPEPDELEIAVRYVPAAPNMHVGGDWYDAFQQPDGATLLVIGDVVGHDVVAAAAMGQIRSTVRTIAYDRQESPAGILDRVDEC